MPRRTEPTPVTTIAAETDKYTAPLLCVPGLWCTAAIWRRAMGFLAHRGWTGHAMHWTALADAAHPPMDTIDDRRGEVLAALEACPVPPVLIGYDLGAWLALELGPGRACAIVALAPLVPGRMPALRSLRIRYAGWRGRGVPATPEWGDPRAPGRTHLESAHVLAALRRPQLVCDLRATPALVVAGVDDPVVAVNDVRGLAERTGAAYHAVAGAGHDLAWGPGWEHRVSAIHRWVVQTLGESLLRLRDDVE